jgi:hypothetical protein
LLPLCLVVVTACSDGGDTGTAPGAGEAAPTLAVKDAAATTREDAALELKLDVAASAGTPEVVITGQPAHGKLSGSGLAYTYTPAVDYNGADTITFSAKLGSQTAAGKVAITITPVNDAPSYAPGGDVTVNEDAGAQVAVWASAVNGGPDDEAAQKVAFTVTNDNAALFAAPPAVDAGGKLSFTPAADVSGMATVTLVAKDDGGTADGGADAAAPETFTITVLAVNDSPAFTPGSLNVAVAEDTGLYSAVWASAIDAGPGEAAQAVTFSVTATPAGLFTLAPALSDAGVLTFMPAADANGTASITVRAWDSGGTALGGRNASGATTFAVTVTAVNDPPSFTGAGNVTVAEDSGAYTGAWITTLSKGPADEAAQSVTYAVSAVPAGLFAVQPALSAGGTLTFTPAADANGSATVTVEAFDSGGGSNRSGTQTFTITVLPVNDAPSFTGAGNVTVAEDAGAYSGAWVASLSKGPANEAAQTVTYAVSAVPAANFAVQPALSAAGTLTFTPAANANGSATVTVRAYDSGGTALGGVNASGAQTFTITLTPVNDAPAFTAGAGTVTVNEDAGAYSAAWASAVAAGPANESAQNVTFAVSAAPSNLFAVQPALSVSGTLTFTPAANANGSATITVRAWDDGGTAGGGANASGTQTFTITVSPVNDAPGFTAGAGPITVSEDSGAYSAAWASAIAAGPANESAQNVTFAVSASPASLFSAQPALSGSGTLTFTPAADANGSATITVRAWDDGGTALGGANASSTQTFTITVTPVNDAPTFAAGAGTVNVNEDAGGYSAAWATGVSAGPANESAQNVTFAVSAAPPSLFSVQPALSASGTLSFTPAANANGSATITVRAWDDGGTAGGGSNGSGTQTFTITVNPVNDAPGFTAGVGTITVSEDSGSYSAAWASAVVAGPGNESAQGVTFAVSASPSSLFTVQPALSASGALTFTPAVNANGSATITVRAWDDGGTALGGANASGTQTFTIAITPVNDAPNFTAGAGTVTVNEDAGVYSAAWATSISTGPADESAQGVTFAVSAVPSTLFSVQPALGASGTLTFTPADNANGSATITVRAWDDGGTALGGANASGTQTFTITVNAVNDAPSFAAGAGTITVGEDSGVYSAAWATAISTGQANESAQTVTFAVSAAPSGLFSVQPALGASGTLTFTPAANATGSATITVKAWDDGGTALGGANASGTQTFTITVNAVNDAPSFTAGASTVMVNEDAGGYSGAWATAVAAGPANESAQNVTFAVSAVPSNLFSVQPALSASGTLSFTPAANASGSATITVRAWDDGGTALGGANASGTQTFTITVNAVNDAPSFTAGASTVTVNEDAAAYSAAWATAVSAGPADEAAQTVTFSVSASPSNVFSVQPAIIGGTLSFTPAANASGSATISVRAWDDGGTALGGANASGTQTFTITVNAVNDAPSFTAGAGAVSVNEDSGAYAAAWATAIAAGPANEAAQNVTFAVFAVPSNLFLVQPAISGGGTLTFTPAANASGSATITVRAWDDGGTALGGVNASGAQTFTISVGTVNDAPSFAAGAGTVTVNEDSGAYAAAWASAISAGPANESSQSVTFAVSASPASLFSVQPVLNGTGTLTFTPAADANGSATITVRAWDDGGTALGGVNASGTQTFTIALTPVNDPPRFTAGPNKFVLDSAGAQSFGGWATGIAPGPIDEFAQTYSFAVTNDANGLFDVQPALANDGTLTFTPKALQSGTASVWVVMTDSLGASATRSFLVIVDAINDAPSFTLGTNVTVIEDAGAYAAAWATGISPGAGEAGQAVDFQITGNTAPALFDVAPAVSAAGVLTFTPKADASGAATITLRLHDDGGTAGGGVDTSAPATFTITVTPVNDAPSFVAGGGRTLPEDAGPQAIPGWAFGMSAGPADEAGQAFAFVVTTAAPALFAVAPTVDALGTLAFAPAANANGTAVVYVELVDGGGARSPKTAVAIALTPVNDAPVFAKGPGQTVFEDAGAASVAGWATGIATGPANEASQSVTTYVVTDNPGLFAVLPAVGLDGKLTYTPAADKYGVANVTLRLVDDGGTAGGGANVSPPQSFSIYVVGVNDAPSFTQGGDVAVSEDPGPQSIAGWATAMSPGPLNEAWQTVSFQVTTGTPALFDGPVAVETDGTLSFRTMPDANGTAAVYVRAVDNGGTAGGGVNGTAWQSFTIDVVPVNDAPSFKPGPNKYVLDTAGAQSFAGWASLMEPGPADEAVTQTYAFAVTNDANALFSVQPALALDGTLTLTPAVGASGTATLWITMTDSGGAASVEVVSVTVDALNDAPSFTAGADVTVTEDGGLYYAPWASAVSAGPGEATQSLNFDISANSNPGLFLMPPAIGADGTLFFWPALNANGTAALTVVLRDDGGTAGGGSDSSAPATLTINLTPVNDPPGFGVGPNPAGLEDDPPQTRPGFATVFSLGAPDEAAQTVTYAVTTDRPSLFAAGPAIDSAGTLTYTPAPDQNGTAHVTAVAFDSGGTALGGVNVGNPRTFDITLTEKNDPPVVVTTGDFAIDEGDPLHKGEGMPFVTTLSPGPADEAWQYLYSVDVTSSNTGLVGCTWIDGYAGQLHFCTGGENSGTAVIFVSVRDSGGTSNGGMDTTVSTVTVTVIAVPDAPHAQDDYVSTAVNTPAWACVTCNDWDPDSMAVTVATVGAPAHGTATAFGSSVQYTPSAGYTGTDTFSYTVSDGTLYSAATVHVWVGPDTTPPHFLAAASRPAGGSVLNREQSFAPYPTGALNPATFVFDDPYLDRAAITSDVTFNGVPLVAGTNYWTDWMSESDRVGIRLADNVPVPDQGGLLVFHLGNVKDTFGNLGSDVNVAVWWDPVAPRAQLFGTWGVNARIIAVFSEPMSTATAASLVFGVPSLGLAAQPDPVNGEGWFSLAATNDAYFFVPDAPFPAGVTIAGSVANFTDLAGNRAEGQNSFSQMPCCSNGQSLRLLSIRFVDPVSGTTVFAGDLSGAADRALVVPNALAGSTALVEARFDASLRVSSGGSVLQGNEMSPNSLRVNGMYKTTVLANDTLVFDPRAADPAFVWRGRDSFRVRFDVQEMPSPASPSGGSSYHDEWRVLLAAGPEDVTAPAVFSTGALRGVGAVPTVRPEEPLQLAFSETIDPRDTVPANFVITGAAGTWSSHLDIGWDVAEAGLRAADAAGRLVALAPGAYTLTVQPLRDVSVNANRSPVRTIPFVVAPAAHPAPRLLAFATPGTNVSLPLTFSFSDRMSPATFTDYGAPAQRGFALEEQWGTQWIPFKGLTAADSGRDSSYPGNVVTLWMNSGGLTEQKQYRLRWLGVTNIDGVPLASAADVTFSSGRYGWPQRPRPELGVKGQEFVAGAQTLMGMPIESSLSFSARVSGCCYGPPAWPWALSVAAPGGVLATPFGTMSDRSVDLNAAQLDAYFGHGRAAYAVSVTDSAGQGFTVFGDLYRFTQAVLTDAQPVVTAPGVNGPGTYTAYGQINDVEAAANVQRVALVLVIGDTTSYPPQWVDVLGFRIAELTRNLDGSLSYRLDSPADQPLPPLPPPYAYSLAPVLDAPSPMGSVYESMAIGVGSAPFDP